MARSIFPALAIFASVLASGETARAQNYNFYNNYNFRPSTPLPYNFYNYQYMTLSNVTPYGSTSFTRYSYNFGPFPTFLNGGNYGNNYGNYNSGNSNPSSYGSSMSGGYAPSYEPQSPILDKQLSAIKSAQRNSQWNGPSDNGPKIDFDTWLAEQSKNRDVNNPAQPVLEIGLINPNDEQLYSGNALNDLAARISAIEAKGKKAAPGLAAPELIDKIVFAGGPAADAMNVFHASKLNYPDILKLPDFNMLVEAFDKAYAPLVESLNAGKKVPIADIERLRIVAEKARPLTEPMLKSASLRDAKALLAFYSTLDSGLKYLKQADSAGVLGTKWNSVGVNVSDLVKHLHKYQVRFGRVANGDDAAYGSLHRGLLAYYAALSQAK